MQENEERKDGKKGSRRKLRGNGVSQDDDRRKCGGENDEEAGIDRADEMDVCGRLPFLLKRRLLTISVMEATFCFCNLSGGIQV